MKTAFITIIALLLLVTNVHAETYKINTPVPIFVSENTQTLTVYSPQGNEFVIDQPIKELTFTPAEAGIYNVLIETGEGVDAYQFEVVSEIVAVEEKILSKTEYYSNEPVIIIASPGQSITITCGEEVYQTLDNTEFPIKFFPKKTGVCTIVLESELEKIIQEFVVLDSDEQEVDVNLNPINQTLGNFCEQRKKEFQSVYKEGYDSKYDFNLDYEIDLRDLGLFAIKIAEQGESWCESYGFTKPPIVNEEVVINWTRNITNNSGVKVQTVQRTQDGYVTGLTIEDINADIEVNQITDLLDITIINNPVAKTRENNYDLGTKAIFVDSNNAKGKLTLKKTGPVNTILKCTILENYACKNWESTNINYTENDTHIIFRVEGFSGYAGAIIDVLNVQSYPIVGDVWQVRFETNSSAPLNINAIKKTTWSLNQTYTDLNFINLTCGDDLVMTNWTGNGLEIQNYTCSQTSFLNNKVLTTGIHSLEFVYGDDLAYANNYATDFKDNSSQIYQTGTAQTFTTAIAITFDSQSLVNTGFTHSGGLNSRLYVNESDNYKISYSCTVEEATSNGRIISEGYLRVNGATELIPSRTSCYTRTNAADSDRCALNGVLYANLTDSDYVELLVEKQGGASGTMETEPDCWLYAQRLRNPVAQIYDSNGGQTFSNTVEVTVDLDSVSFIDTSSFTEDTANGRIYVDETGIYKIYYQTCAIAGAQNSRHNGQTYVWKNGAAIIPSNTFSYIRQTGAGGNLNCEQGILLQNLSANDGIQLRHFKNGTESSGTTSTMIDQSWLLIEKVPVDDVLMIYESEGGQSVSEGGTAAITIDTNYAVGKSFTHAGDTAVFSIEESGWYEVSYTYSWDDGGTPGRNTGCAWLRRNGVTDIQPSKQCDYGRGVADVRYMTVSANFLINATAGDYFSLIASMDGASATSLRDGVWITIIPLNKDLFAPKWFNATEFPSDPESYNPLQSNQFNVTWIDDNSIDYVWIEHNFTGTFANYTIFSNQGSEYFYEYTTLPVGNYFWRMFANDTTGNLNVTDQFTYTVIKGTPLINLSFNSVSNNVLVELLSVYNVSAQNIFGDGIIEILQDSEVVSFGQNNTWLYVLFDNLGVINFTARHNETNNYLFGNQSYLVTVQDTIEPFVNITSISSNPAEIGQDVVIINWTTTDPLIDSYYANVTYPNGSMLGQYIDNITLFYELTAIGNYTITLFANDTSNNQNSTSMNLTVVDTITPIVNLNNPQNNTYYTAENVVFDYTVIDNDIDTCILYGNFSGIWNANSTNNSIIYPDNNFTINLSDGVYLWNVFCQDYAGNNAFNSSNNTVIVDSSIPTAVDVRPVNMTEYDYDSIIELSVNVTDNAISEVYANLSLSNFEIQIIPLNYVGGNKYNTSYALNNKTGFHNVTYYAKDYANNTRTINTTIVSIGKTSLLGVLLNLSDFNFSSDTYEVGIAVNFNTSSLFTGLLLGTSFNLEKHSGIVENNIFAKVELDGINYSEQKIGYIIEAEKYVATGLKPQSFIVPKGIHNLTIWVRRTGDGTIGMENIDLILGQLQSSAELPLIGGLFNTEYTLTNTIPSDNSNYSINLPYKSDVLHIFHSAIEADSPVLTTHYFRDRDDDRKSTYWQRFIKNSSDIGSVASFGIDYEQIGLKNYSVVSYNNQTAETTMNTTRVNIVLRDSQPAKITTRMTTNISTNLSTPGTFAEGKHLIASTTISLENGSGFFIAATNTVKSLTGNQNVLYSINSSVPTPNNCGSEKKRSLSDEDDYANIFFFTGCSNLTLGNNYTFNMWLEVSPGEVVEQTDEVLLVIEAKAFDIRTTDVPPLAGEITNPLNGTGKRGLINITWNAFEDPNGDDVYYNISLLNAGHTFNQTISGNQSETYVQFNLGLLEDISYVIRIVGCDITDRCAVSESHFTVDRINPSVQDLIPINGSKYPQGSIIEIAANISENVYHEFAGINITLPNGSSYNYSLSNTTELNPYSLHKHNVSYEIPYLSGFYTVQFYANDTAGNNNNTEITMFYVNETIPPNYSSISFDPVYPVAYNVNALYNFNTTWFDNNGLEYVYLENNFSGTRINNTITPQGNNYPYSISDLAVGSYYLRWHAKDFDNNVNQTPEIAYEIIRGNPQINLYLNGSQDNFTTSENSFINITAEVLAGDSGYVELYQNNTLINSGFNKITNISLYDTPGSYNISILFPETQNYTAYHNHYILTILDNTPPTITLVSPDDGVTIGSLDISFVYNVTDFSSIDNCSIYINGSLNDTNYDLPKSELLNFNLTFTEGTYEWQIACVDDSFNQQFSEVRNFSAIDSTIINLNVTTNKITYEINEPVNITSNSTDLFYNPLTTNITTQIIKGNTSNPWWNSSYKHRKTIQLSNSINKNIIGGVVEVNISGLQNNISSCANELRIIRNESTNFAEIPYEIISTDNTNYCKIRFNANISANTNNEIRYFAYYNNSQATNPSYNYVPTSILIQRNTITGTSNSFTDTIQEINPEETFIIVNANSASSNPNANQYTPNITNPFQVAFNSYASSTATINYQTITSPNIYVQSGTQTLGTTDSSSTININRVDSAQSFIIVYGRANTATTANNNHGFFTGRFVNETQIILERGTTGSAATVYWQVIEWGGAIVQNGTTSVGTSTAAAISSINTSSSILVFQRRISGDTGLDANLVRGLITSNTAINFDRVAGTGSATTEWFVVQLPNINLLQNGTNDITTDTNQAITSVNLSRAFSLSSHGSTGGGTTYTNSMVRSELTTSTNLLLDKQTTSNNNYIAWFVTELEEYTPVIATTGSVTKFIEENNSATDILGIYPYTFKTNNQDLGWYTALSIATKPGYTPTSYQDYFNIIPDTTGPIINNPVVNTSQINQSYTILITDTIFDYSEITIANVSIKYPNGTTKNFTLINTSATNYLLYFSDTNSSGIYNITQVYARDIYGNTNIDNFNGIGFEVTNSPPSTFTLLLPINATESKLLQPNVSWSFSTDEHFDNYTIQFDKSNTFASIDFEYYTSNNNYYTLDFTLDANTAYYWRVIAYDVFGSSTVSQDYFIYKTDLIKPKVNLSKPVNNATIANPLVQFNYTVTDANTIANCTLFTNSTGSWAANITNNSITQINNSFDVLLPNGVFKWNVRCYDLAGNYAFNNTNRTLSVDTVGPSVSEIIPQYQEFYEEDSIEISVNVTDLLGVNTVIANVSLPNGSWNSVSLSNINGNKFNASYALNNLPGVYNITINATDFGGNYNDSLSTQFLRVSRTAILGVILNVTDFNFSSTESVAGIGYSFNTSKAFTGLLLGTSMNIRKYSGTEQNIVYAKVQLDGINYTEQKLRSISSTGSVGATGLKPASFIVEKGVHNLTIWFRRTGDGEIGVENVDMLLGQLVSSQENSLQGGLYDSGYNFTSLELTDAYNYSINTPYLADSVHIIHSTIQSNNSVLTTHFFRDRDSLRESTRWQRYLRNDADIGSAASFGIDYNQIGNKNYSVVSYNNQTANSYANISRVDIILRDSQPARIGSIMSTNEETNTSNPKTYGPGIHLLTNATLRLYNGSGFFVAASNSVKSLSGIQDVEYIINSSTFDATKCTNNKERTLTSVDDVGNIYFFTGCSNLTIGNEYTFDMWLKVPTGHSVEQIDEVLILIEAQVFDTRTTDVAPLAGIITNPLNGTGHKSIINITWTNFYDPNNDPVYYNISLLNFDNTFNQSINQNTSLQYSSYDLSGLEETLYGIRVEACDTTELCTPIINQFFVDLTPPIVTNILPNNTNSTQGSTIEISANVTDISVVDSVYAIIFIPNGSSYSYNLEYFTGDIYNTSFLIPSVAGFYNITIVANDTANNINNTQNSSFYVYELIPPTYTNISVNPSSPTNYSLTNTYYYNITWNDNKAMNLVYFESNFSGLFINYTTIDMISHYTYNIVGLNVSNYSYRWVGIDEDGNVNKTDYYTFTITKKYPDLFLFINGTAGNNSINEDNQANLTTYLTEPLIGNISLYVSNSLAGFGLSPLQNISVFNYPNTYNITALYAGSNNYLSRAITYYLRVNDTNSPNITLIFPDNATTVGTLNVNFLYNVTDDSTLANCTIYIDGLLETTVNNPLTNTLLFFPVNFAEGNYTWQISCYDDENNYAYTEVRDIEVIDASIIRARVGLNNLTVESGSIAFINTNTTDAFNSLLQTNVTTDIIKGQSNLSWWNNSYAYRKSILINTTDLYPHRYMVVANISNLDGNISSCLNEVRIVQNISQTQTIVPAHLLVGDNSNYCLFEFEAYLEGNSESIKEYTAYYGNPSATNPGVNDINVTYRIQKNTVSSTSNSLIANIAPVDLSHAFVTYSTISSDTSPDGSMFTGVLTTNQITFSAYASSTNSISYQVIEHPDLYVQRGSTTFNVAETTRQINTSYEFDPSKSLILVDGRASSTTAGLHRDGWVSAEFIDNNTIEIKRNSSTTTATAVYQIIEWNNTNIQSGITRLSNTATATADLNNVIINKSFIYASYRTDSAAANINDQYVRYYFSNESRITFSRDDGEGIVDVTWYVVELPEGSLVQHNETATTATTTNVGITTINYSRSFVIKSHQSQGTGTTFTNAYNRINISNANNVAITRQTTSNIHTINSQAIELAPITDLTLGLNPQEEFITTNSSDTGIDANWLWDWSTLTQDLGYYSVISRASREGFTNGSSGKQFEIVPDQTPPNITLIVPGNGSQDGAQAFEFSYSAVDPNLDSCILWGDFNGTWSSNQTDVNLVSGEVDYFNETIFLNSGIYTWNVFCNDTFGNGGFSEFNFTLNVTFPDLFVTNIVFVGGQIEDANITVVANITNIGDTPIENTNYTIGFYKGDPDNGGIQIGTLTNISDLNVSETISLNTTFIANAGYNNIYVLVNIGNYGNESNFENNKINESFSTSAYHTYFGSNTGNYVLSDGNNNPVLGFYNITNISGNLYVTDIDSDISFTDLVPIGRNELNLPTANDFSDIDTLLNISSYPDSINKLWTGGTNNPINTRTIQIYGSNITNVPIVNSTNTTSFYTGLLWDSSDDSGNLQFDQTDKEDIVFMTTFNESKQGGYGIYDFEIKAPAILRDYKPGNDRVILYVEIQ